MSDRLLVGSRKGLFDLRRRANGAWEVERVSFLGSTVSMVLRDARDATLYAALDLGHFGVKLHRSDDEGKTWEEIAVPSYAGLAPVSEDKPAPSLKLIWALEPAGPDLKGQLWAGTVPGGLFKSEDRGATWTLNEGLWNVPDRVHWMGAGNDQPAIHSICIDPRSPSHIAIAISTGGVWQTFDSGGTWEKGGPGLRAEYMPPELSAEQSAQDVHRLIACAAHPDVYWIQHHNGTFRSTDGLKSFSEFKVTPSSFGFALAVHPGDPNTAWYVPAKKDEFRYPVDGKVVVTRTRDGAKSFDVLTEGLPQKDAYDLIYRHGLVVDDTGTRLAMGSTTGNLWLSDDGGDRWSLLNAHLPPIYVLRFA